MRTSASQRTYKRIFVLSKVLSALLFAWTVVYTVLIVHSHHYVLLVLSPVLLGLAIFWLLWPGFVKDMM